MLRVKDSVLFPLVLAAGNPVPIQVARALVKDCVLSPLVFIAGYPVIILGAINCIGRPRVDTIIYGLSCKIYIYNEQIN